MSKYCPCCGGEILNRKRAYCDDVCREVYHEVEREKKILYDTLRLIADPIAIDKLKGFIETTFQDNMVLKRKCIIAQRRMEEQDNFWENLVSDLREDYITAAHIRWWRDKLVKEHRVSAQSRMINWLNGVASVLEVYGEAKKSEKVLDS